MPPQDKTTPNDKTTPADSTSDRPDSNDWVLQTCRPCEGGVDPIPADAAAAHTAGLDDWTINETGTAIGRTINTGDFRTALDRIASIGELAEREQHHPDLHLTGYRHLAIELTTHAIGGLSDNDFIVAAKIDRILRRS